MATDPYRYYRIEAREILDGLDQGVLALEKGSGGGEIVVRLLRLAHTLKGASRVVKQTGVAELAHAFEGALSSHRDGNDPVPRERVSALLHFLDGIRTHLGALEPKATTADGAAPSADVEEPFQTVRIDIGEMDALLQGVSEAGVRLAALRRDIESVDRARRLATAVAEQLSPRLGPDPNGATGAQKARSMAEELRATLEGSVRSLVVSVEQAEHEVAEVRDQARQLRLLPTSTIFALLKRAARDVADSVKKEIDFETSGGDIRLDAHVLAALRDALSHVVRNAVAHGIETEQERRVRGKPLAGRIRIDVERRGHRVAFVCRDDGRGVDADAVRRAALARGLISSAEAAALGPDDAARLILRGGVTTTGVVTQVSGRGVGLDVLRATIARLKGDIVLTSKQGNGTTIDVCVPVSLSSMNALVVEVGDTVASLPLDAVRQTLRLVDRDVARSAGGDSIACNGKVIPFLPLARALGQKTLARAGAFSAVVVEAGGSAVAVGVDRLLGTSNVVVRPLPTMVDRIAVVAGASLDAEGSPQLVLDPVGIVAAARGAVASAGIESAAPRAPILVVDDSLTTRMLEQSILESAGYEVVLATSAEEALVKAREQRYGVFVVDVEMPGMDGFEFVEKTRQDPVLRETPAILVTSRSAPADRRRGEEVGARGYIVKGEFDQGHLLRLIRDLLGKGASR